MATTQQERRQAIGDSDKPQKLNLADAARELRTYLDPKIRDRVALAGGDYLDKFDSTIDGISKQVLQAKATERDTMSFGLGQMARDLVTSFGWDRGVAGSKSGDIRVGEDRKLTPVGDWLDSQGYSGNVSINLGSATMQYTAPHQQWANEKGYGNDPHGSAFFSHMETGSAGATDFDNVNVYRSTANRNGDLLARPEASDAIGASLAWQIKTNVQPEDLKMLQPGNASSADFRDVLKSAGRALGVDGAPDLRDYVPDAIIGDDTRVAQELATLMESSVLAQAVEKGDTYTIESLLRGTTGITRSYKAKQLSRFLSAAHQPPGSPSGSREKLEGMVKGVLGPIGEVDGEKVYPPVDDYTTIIRLYNAWALAEGVRSGQVSIND